MTTKNEHHLRTERRERLRELATMALDAEAGRRDVISQRDALLVELQGPPAEGRFTYSELAEITGLTKTRVSQIIRSQREMAV